VQNTNRYRYILPPEKIPPPKENLFLKLYMFTGEPLNFGGCSEREIFDGFDLLQSFTMPENYPGICTPAGVLPHLEKTSPRLDLLGFLFSQSWKWKLTPNEKETTMGDTPIFH